MYANLTVTCRRKSDGKVEQLPAYSVEVKEDRTVIYLDGQDGSGSYYEEAGVTFRTHKNYEVEIGACF